MSEAWRVKTYYDKRILIPTGDVLGAPRPDMLVCLTGVQASLLRNMCQYLHRRSTFVSEYRTTTYLAPTEQEWDDIQAIVAETEDILMGCEDYLALLQCICDGVRELKGVNWPAGGQLEGQPDYDDYSSPVEYEVGDPPVLFATWDDWRDGVCIGAQKLFDDLSDLMAKLQVWYSAGAAITFSLFQTLVLASVVVPPVAVVLAIVEVLVVAYTALSVLAVEEWIGDHKFGLVCAVFNSDTQGEAMAAIAAYVAENWDLLIGPQFFNLLVNQKVVSQIFDGTMPNWDDWSGGYSAGYCGGCPEPPIQGPDWFAVPVYGPDWTRSRLVDGEISWCFPAVEIAERYVQGIIYQVESSQAGYCSHKTMSRNTCGCPTDVGNMFADSAPLYTVGMFARLNVTGIDEVGCAAYFSASLTTAGVNAPYQHGEGAMRIAGSQGRTITATVKYVIWRGTIP